MFGIVLQIRPNSLYSIRVPYSYQCARTYPLPGPSTLKGLCANALWQFESGEPEQKLDEICAGLVCASARADYTIAVTACTVSQIIKPKTTNALLRQFAHTPALRAAIFLKDEKLAARLSSALRRSSVYLGDSESLVTMTTTEGPKDVGNQIVQKGSQIKDVNTLTPELVMKRGTLCVQDGHNMTVLLMQEDPKSPEAELRRYVAPLISQGDNYEPVESFSFVAAQECFMADIAGMRVVWPVESGLKAEGKEQKSKRGKK